RSRSRFPTTLQAVIRKGSMSFDNGPAHNQLCTGCAGFRVTNGGGTALLVSVVRFPRTHQSSGHGVDTRVFWPVPWGMSDFGPGLTRRLVMGLRRFRLCRGFGILELG